MRVLFGRRMNSDYALVLQRLIEYRKAKHLSQKDVCERLGISQSTYSKMETGAKKISYDMLCKLQTLGIDIDYLITGRVDEDSENQLADCYRLINPEKKNEFSRIIMILLKEQMADSDKEPIEIQLLKDYLENGQMNDYSVIVSLRKIRNVNQEMMREELETYVKKLRNIEKGREYPDASILTLLYTKYQCRPSYIINNAISQEKVLGELWAKYHMGNKPMYMDYLQKTIKILQDKKS